MTINRIVYIPIFALLFLFSTNAQNINQMPTISVTGMAEVNVVPDSAVFNLFVEKVNKDVLAAKKENDASISQIIALTKKFGMEEKDVKTDFISVSKRYENVGSGASRRTDIYITTR